MRSALTDLPCALLRQALEECEVPFRPTFHTTSIVLGPPPEAICCGCVRRLNFLGDLHFNSCVLFSDARLPAGGGGDGGSLHRWPQTMGTASGQLTEVGR